MTAHQLIQGYRESQLSGRTGTQASALRSRGNPLGPRSICQVKAGGRQRQQCKFNQEFSTLGKLKFTIPGLLGLCRSLTLVSQQLLPGAFLKGFQRIIFLLHWVLFFFWQRQTHARENEARPQELLQAFLKGDGGGFQLRSSSSLSLNPFFKKN